MRRVLAAALLVISAGCIHRVRTDVAPRVEDVKVGSARFVVTYWPDDARSARKVVDALALAAPRVARWGPLSQPVAITVRPTHDALEAAVHREGYDWLRAWARYAEIDIQSPDSWSIFEPSEAEVVELVTHELAHCAMYQNAATEFNWPYKGIPLWFREGLASVTAHQGYRRGKLEDLWRYYEQSAAGSGGDGAPGASARVAAGSGAGEGDPIADPDPMYQRQSEVVYGAAHHAFRFLLERYGQRKVDEVLALMAGGKTFGRAFEDAIGITEPEFTADFRRYVVWQGWRH